jgi:hypothetical protein
MVSTIEDVAPSDKEWPDLLVGIGIARRKADNVHFFGEEKWIADKEKGVFVYWEPEQKYGKSSEAGHTGMAVLVDPKMLVKVIEDNPEEYVMVVKVVPGVPWVYYAGACWDLGQDFKTAGEWERYALEFKSNFDVNYKYTAESVK